MYIIHLNLDGIQKPLPWSSSRSFPLHCHAEHLLVGVVSRRFLKCPYYRSLLLISHVSIGMTFADSDLQVVFASIVTFASPRVQQFFSVFLCLPGQGSMRMLECLPDSGFTLRYDCCLSDYVPEFRVYLRVIYNSGELSPFIPCLAHPVSAVCFSVPPNFASIIAPG